MSFRRWTRVTGRVRAHSTLSSDVCMLVRWRVCFRQSGQSFHTSKLPCDYHATYYTPENHMKIMLSRAARPLSSRMTRHTAHPTAHGRYVTSVVISRPSARTAGGASGERRYAAGLVATHGTRCSRGETFQWMRIVHGDAPPKMSASLRARPCTPQRSSTAARRRRSPRGGGAGRRRVGGRREGTWRCH